MVCKSRQVQQPGATVCAVGRRRTWFCETFQILMAKLEFVKFKNWSSYKSRKLKILLYSTAPHLDIFLHEICREYYMCTTAVRTCSTVHVYIHTGIHVHILYEASHVHTVWHHTWDLGTCVVKKLINPQTRSSGLVIRIPPPSCLVDVKH